MSSGEEACSREKEAARSRETEKSECSGPDEKTKMPMKGADEGQGDDEIIL